MRRPGWRRGRALGARLRGSRRLVVAKIVGARVVCRDCALLGGRLLPLLVVGRGRALLLRRLGWAGRRFGYVGRGCGRVGRWILRRLLNGLRGAASRGRVVTAEGREAGIVLRRLMVCAYRLGTRLLGLRGLWRVGRCLLMRGGVGLWLLCRRRVLLRLRVGRCWLLLMRLRRGSVLLAIARGRCLARDRCLGLAGIGWGISLRRHTALMHVRWQTGLGYARWRGGLHTGRTSRRLLWRLTGRALLLRVIRVLIGIRRLVRAVICGPAVRWSPRSVGS